MLFLTCQTVLEGQVEPKETGTNQRPASGPKGWLPATEARSISGTASDAADQENFEELPPHPPLFFPLFSSPLFSSPLSSSPLSSSPLSSCPPSSFPGNHSLGDGRISTCYRCMQASNYSPSLSVSNNYPTLNERRPAGWLESTIMTFVSRSSAAHSRSQHLEALAMFPQGGSNPLLAEHGTINLRNEPKPKRCLKLFVLRQIIVPARRNLQKT